VADELPTTTRKQRGVRFYITVAAVIVAAIFILQNSQEVKVKFFFSTTTIPLIFALLLATVLGFIIGLALPRFRHHDD
jgi:uncharacterized integral membrane protein